MIRPVLTAAALGLAAAAAAEPRVEFRDGRLSLEAEAEPVGTVLGAVGAAVGLEVPVLAEAEGSFSGRFTDLSLVDGLRRLLGTRSFTLQYDAAGRPERLVLLGAAAPAPETPRAAEAPPPVEAFIDPLSPGEEERFVAERLTDRDIGARVVAVRRLPRLPPERAATLARQVATSEPEWVVRVELARALGRVPGEPPVAVLATLAGDPEPSVRTAALTALAAKGGPTAEAELRRVADRAGDPLAATAGRLLACAGQAGCRAD